MVLLGLADRDTLPFRPIAAGRAFPASLLDMVWRKAPERATRPRLAKLVVGAQPLFGSPALAERLHADPAAEREDERQRHKAFHQPKDSLVLWSGLGAFIV